MAECSMSVDQIESTESMYIESTEPSTSLGPGISCRCPRAARLHAGHMPVWAMTSLKKRCSSRTFPEPPKTRLRVPRRKSGKRSPEEVAAPCLACTVNSVMKDGAGGPPRWPHRGGGTAG
uniref:Uncharacterized protein n=1 Tax=Alexandrium monilatum TaxID=311494 RepID=A0A7S4PXI0_9DINO